MIVTEDGIRYQIIHGKATAIGLEKAHFGSCLNIPSTVGDNYTVTAIGENAFERTARLKSVYLPETLTKIGRNAFYSCIELTAIYMKKSPQKNHRCEVDKYAFAFCSELQLIDIPAILFIEQQACIHCRRLQHITGAIISLGKASFCECKKIDMLFFADNAELVENVMEGATIDNVIFLGDAIVGDATLKAFQDSNTTIQCTKGSNIVGLGYYGVKIKI